MILAFVIVLMTLLAPAGDHSEVGGAIARVVEAERPLFQHDEDHHRTAALVAAVAFREGSLRRRVHGDCHDGTGRSIPTPPNGVCEHPRSFCTMQIHVTSGGSERLNDDPEACIRIGLAMLRTSMHLCPAHPIAFYAAGPGACENARAQRISRDRMWLAASIVRRAAP